MRRTRSRTTFEWENGLNGLMVTKFGELQINNLRMWIEDHNGVIEFEILMPFFGDRTGGYEFIDKAIDGLKVTGKQYWEDKYTLCFSPINGEAFTETMFKRLIKFFATCGITIPCAPRVLSEKFHYLNGKYTYGEMLFRAYC